MTQGYILRSEWIIEYTPREFLDYYYLIEEKTKWDRNISKILVHPQNRKAIYVMFKRIGLISARDMLIQFDEF